MARPLAGIRVLDLGTGISGAACTKLFADYGADVVKVEPPDGDPTRACPPFIDGVPGPDRSAVFLHLNTNKRSITLDLDGPLGRGIFERLAGHADVVIETFRPGTMERLGLGWERLRSVNPRLVLVRITAFGQTGPYRDFEATDLVLEAMGGTMAANGLPGMPPLRKPGRLSATSIGVAAAEAALAALFAARRQDRGFEVDVAAFEVLLSSLDRRRAALVTTSYSGADEPRFGLRQFPPQRVLPCADGLVMAFVTRFFLQPLLTLIGDAELAAQLPPERLSDNAIYSDDEAIDLLEDRLRRWLLPRSKREVMAAAQAARVPITAVLSGDELLADPHFQARGAFVAAEHAVAGRLAYAGAPWRMRDGWRLERTAPRLGEHTAEVLREAGVDAGPPERRRGAGVV